MGNKILSLWVVLAIAINASAYDFSAVNDEGLTIYYNITSSGGKKTCEVAKSPVADDYSGIVTIPAEVTYQGSTYYVTSIGQNAFSECYDLSAVSIPDKVTSIGDYAFVSCTYLESVVLPNSLASIGERAFASCTGLTSIEIPDKVTSIGDCAFYGCYSMESFSGKLASSDGRCLIVDNVLNSIAPAGMTSCRIPDYVTSIGDWVFSNCTSLTSVEIPNKVTSIGDYAFLFCSGLESLTLPDSVTYIGDNAFSGCSFTSLTLPDSVTTIGVDAFSCCDRITSLVIPSSDTSIGELAFELCDSLTSVAIYSPVTSMGSCVFKKCPNLESFSGKFASADGRCLIFDHVLNSFAPAGLTSYEIPNTVTSIGDGVFCECTALMSLTIPDSVKSIGAPGFAGCSSLKAIIFMSDTPPAVQYKASDNDLTDTCILIVPNEAAVKTYKAADYWRDFKNIVSANAR